MTIEECYVKMGANYQDVIKRLPSAKMIEKGNPQLDRVD